MLPASTWSHGSGPECSHAASGGIIWNPSTRYKLRCFFLILLMFTIVLTYICTAQMENTCNVCRHLEGVTLGNLSSGHYRYFILYLFNYAVSDPDFYSVE
jgi:hypothetical protein